MVRESPVRQEKNGTKQVSSLTPGRFSSFNRFIRLTTLWWVSITYSQSSKYAHQPQRFGMSALC